MARKRPAFHGFATLCRLFNGARIERFGRQDELGHYRLAARKDGMEILALWCCGREATVAMPLGKRAVDIVGGAMTVAEGEPITIGESVVYLVDDRLEDNRSDAHLGRGDPARGMHSP